MFCYHVSDGDPGQHMILFCKTSIEAKRHWANEHGDGEHIAGISAKRCKGYDQYAPGPVPALVLVDDGWWFECHGCGCTINDDGIGQPIDDEDDNSPLMAPVEEKHQSIWCHAGCRDRDLAERARIKRMQGRALKTMKAAILKRYPGVTFPDREYSAHVFVGRAQGRLLVHQIAIQFEVPGMKYGGCCFRACDEKWRYGRDEIQGPIQTSEWKRKKLQPHLSSRKRDVTLGCANGDKSLWDEWTSDSANEALGAEALSSPGRLGAQSDGSFRLGE